MCKITIGIAVYNVEKYIGEALLSVLNQDYEDLDIIVCDDCSTDNSMNIVYGIINKHPNGHKVRIISNSVNSGTSIVRNKCIDCAKGEYIYFLDGDDYISEDCISTLYHAMQEKPSDIVMANHTIFNDPNSGVKHLLIKDIVYPDYRTEGEMAVVKWMKSVPTDIYPGSLWNKLYRLNFLKNEGIRCKPSHEVIDDIYFSFLTLIKAKSFYSLSQVTHHWRQRSGSAMNRDYTEERLNLYHQIFDDMCDELIEIKNKYPNKDIPKEIFIYIGKRYYFGFVMLNIIKNKNVSRKYKEYYFDHLYRLVDLGFKKEHLSSILERLLLNSWNHRYRYWIIKYSLPYFDYIRKINRYIIKIYETIS